MNYYPEQLRFLASACEKLNALERESGENNHTYLGKIEVMEDTLIIGHLKDEIGGSYSFFPLEEHETISPAPSSDTE